MEENIKHLAVEARARLIWGNPRSEVEEWLISQGLSSPEVKVIIETSWRERNLEIRKLGIRDITIGCFCLIGGGLLYLLGACLPYGYGWRDLQRDAWAIMILLCLYGIWRAFRGINRFISGANTEGSMTEM